MSGARILTAAISNVVVIITTLSSAASFAQDEPATLPKADFPWMNEAARLQFVQRPLVGKIGGQPFVPVRNELGPEPDLGGFYLRFWNGNNRELPTQCISIKLAARSFPVEGATFMVYNEQMNWENTLQVILYDQKLPTKIQTLEGIEACGMRLQFGREKKGLLPGYIVFRANTKPETSLSGYFYVPVAATK
jgi:hypothetical protein